MARNPKMRGSIVDNRALQWILYTPKRAKRVLAGLALLTGIIFAALTTNYSTTTTSTAAATSSSQPAKTCTAVAETFTTAYYGHYDSPGKRADAVIPYADPSISTPLRYTTINPAVTGVDHTRKTKTIEQPGACDATVPTSPTGTLTLQLEDHGSGWIVSGVTP